MNSVSGWKRPDVHLYKKQGLTLFCLGEWEMHTVEESTRLGTAIKALDSFSDSKASLSNEKRQKLSALTSNE
jgi:hypothetical protein